MSGMQLEPVEEWEARPIRGGFKVRLKDRGESVRLEMFVNVTAVVRGPRDPQTGQPTFAVVSVNSIRINSRKLSR